MIVVRNCFVAKPGMASKLAAQLKEAAAAAPGGTKFRVMTDLTGDFNRVILEFDGENIGRLSIELLTDKSTPSDAASITSSGFFFAAMISGSFA